MKRNCWFLMLIYFLFMGNEHENCLMRNDLKNLISVPTSNTVTCCWGHTGPLSLFTDNGEATFFFLIWSFDPFDDGICLVFWQGDYIDIHIFLLNAIHKMEAFIKYKLSLIPGKRNEDQINMRITISISTWYILGR